MALASKLLGHSRLIPLMTLVLLSFPVEYLTTLSHELGHGLMGLALGSPFSGIFLGANTAYALVGNSPLVSVGGWVGQYVLAAGVGLAAWKDKPNGFAARSLIFIIVTANLLGPPFEVASLNGDSGNLLLMVTPFLGASMVVAILEGTAAALLIVGVYFSFGVARNYFMHIFPWVTNRGSEFLALLTIAYVVANETLGFLAAWFELPLLFFFVIVGFLLVPARPISQPLGMVLPSLTTFAIAIAAFLLTEAFTYFVLPITIPL